jgi:hypothetical protein
VTQTDGNKHRLEAISDQLMAEADAVKRLEAEKRTHPISTPEFHELADAIADHARRVFRLADSEEVEGDRLPHDGDTIDDVHREQAG